MGPRLPTANAVAAGGARVGGSTTRRRAPGGHGHVSFVGLALKFEAFAGRVGPRAAQAKSAGHCICCDHGGIVNTDEGMILDVQPLVQSFFCETK